MCLEIGKKNYSPEEFKNLGYGPTKLYQPITVIGKALRYIQAVALSPQSFTKKIKELDHQADDYLRVQESCFQTQVPINREQLEKYIKECQQLRRNLITHNEMITIFKRNEFLLGEKSFVLNTNHDSQIIKINDRIKVLQNCLEALDGVVVLSPKSLGEMEDKVLDEFREEIQSGKLVLSDAVIHKAVMAKLEAVGSYDEQFLIKLRKLINTMYLHKIINNRSTFLASNNEVRMLKALGYNLEVFESKDLVYSIVAAQVLELQKQTGFPDKTLKELHEDIKQEALFQRLKILEESDQAAFNLSIALSQFTILNKEINKSMELYIREITLQAFAKLTGMPVSKEFLLKNFKMHCLQINGTVLGGFISKNKVIIREKNLLAKKSDVYREHLNQSLLEVFRSTKMDELNKYYKKIYQDLIENELHYLLKWQDNFSVNLIQGIKDNNEDLGKGVCWGYAHRVGSIDQLNPNAKDDGHLNAGKIIPKDRILQNIQTCSTAIVYRLGSREDPEGMLALKNKGNRTIAKRCGFKSYIDHGKCEKSVVVKISELDQAEDKPLERSNGVLYLDLHGDHSIYIRFDSKRGIYRYVDADIGVFTLRVDPSSTSREEVQQTFFSFLEDTLKCFYSDYTSFEFHQLVDTL